MNNLNRNELIALAIKYHGDYLSIFNAIKNGEVIKPIYDIDAITYLDDDYPNCFKKLDYPPFVLFYKGNKELLKTKCVGIVGSRNICDYAKKATYHLGTFLAKENTIVSGLAKGVDTIAHLSAIEYKTIAILGSGIDYIYPKENAGLYNDISKNHLIISEYPDNTKPIGTHFPFRNRLIAALSDELYVMQARIKSGSMTTVNEMIALNKEVYALPYEIFDENGEGTNLLICEGANMIVINDYQ